jgi:hypothetical protein
LFSYTFPLIGRFSALSFVFLYIPGLFRRKAISSQLLLANRRKVKESRVESRGVKEHLPLAADFLTLLFVFINIPGLFLAL